MGIPAYPRGRDLETLLTGAGFTIPTGMDLDREVNAGITAFEQATGRTMLAATGTRTYDPPAGTRDAYLPLGEDLWGNPTAVSYSGTSLVLNTDYRVLPQNATARGKPITALRFMRVWYRPLGTANWAQISVTGSWGYNSEIPEDAWEAMLVRGAYLCLPQLEHSLTGGMTSFHEDDVSEDYGSDPLGTLGKQWSATYDHAVRRYKRVVDALIPG